MIFINNFKEIKLNFLKIIGPVQTIILGIRNWTANHQFQFLGVKNRTSTPKYRPNWLVHSDLDNSQSNLFLWLIPTCCLKENNAFQTFTPAKTKHYLKCCIHIHTSIIQISPLPPTPTNCPLGGKIISQDQTILSITYQPSNSRDQ